MPKLSFADIFRWTTEAFDVRQWTTLNDTRSASQHHCSHREAWFVII